MRILRQAHLVGSICSRRQQQQWRGRNQRREDWLSAGAEMSKKTVLKVDTSCCKCKRRVMLAVTSLHGVDRVEIDSEKSTVTVTGRVDPVEVVVATRTKAGKRAAIVTIGAPPSTASKPEEKKHAVAAAERKAPEMPVTVYVHQVHPSWPPLAYDHGAAVDYHHHQQQDGCSVM